MGVCGLRVVLFCVFSSVFEFVLGRSRGYVVVLLGFRRLGVKGRGGFGYCSSFWG